MKFLLVLFVVMVGVWIWRSNRASDKPPAPRRGAGEHDAIDMVGCDLCGVHSPRTDLVVGRRGVYCSVQHRNQAEA